jgi:Winged helix DNA-binding domain
MPRSLSEEQLRLLRLRAQRLSGERPRDVHEVVRAMGGIQAQDTPASRLAVRPRGAGLDAAAVRAACNRERSVVRTWAMRGTLHMVTAEDVRWLVALLGPGSAAANRRRRLQLGLDDDRCARGLRAIGKVLGAHGPLPRGELVSRLAAEGVELDPRSQAPAHLVAFAAMQGLVCRGPDLDGDEPTYVLLDDWVGDRRPLPDPEAALAELTRRYLGAHGPAAPPDLAAWAGIAAGRARRGFELLAGELVEVAAAGAPAWTLGRARVPRPGRGGPCVRLLFRFDDYLLGWRGRDLVLSPRFARRIQAGGGWIHPAVLVDGRVVGTWRLAARAGDRLTVAVEPFEPLDGALPGLEAEAADLGRFLGAAATLSVADPGEPAARR